MVKTMRIGTGAVIVLALAFPIPVMGEDLDIDLVLREVGEQMDLLRDWVTDRLADFGPREEESQPLGKTVRLTFTLERVGRSFTVTTATSAYLVAGHGSESSGEADEGHEAREIAFNAHGTLFLNGPEDALLVTCEGSFMVIENSEREEKAKELETGVEFRASALLRSGEKRVIASQGDLKLTLAVTIEPES